MLRPCLDKAPPSLGTHTLGLASNLTIAMSFNALSLAFAIFIPFPLLLLQKQLSLSADLCGSTWYFDSVIFCLL